MAQEKARPTRARAKKEIADAEAPAKAVRKTRAKPTNAAEPKAKSVTRRKPVAPRSPEEVATLAYLMWERGEPGDAWEHWIRAEQELEAA